MKSRILKAAAELIEREGTAFRMDDLAKAMNMSKRTLYEQFRSKHEIIERIVLEKAEDFYEQHKAILEDPNLSFGEALQSYFMVKSNLYTSLNGGHFREMFNTMAHLIDELMVVLEKDWQLLSAYLVEKQQQGYIKSSVNIDLIILMLQGIVHRIMYDATRTPDELCEIMPEVIQMILYGIQDGEK